MDLKDYVNSERQKEKTKTVFSIPMFPKFCQALTLILCCAKAFGFLELGWGWCFSPLMVVPILMGIILLLKFLVLWLWD